MKKKKSRYEYKPYTGPKGFVFMRAAGPDMALADSLAAALAEKNVRLFYDCEGCRDAAGFEDVAAGITNSERVIFILSEYACAHRDFRNSINFALKENKRIVCIRDRDFVPGYGLDIQLANVPTITSRATDEIVRELEAADFIPEMVRGDGLIPKKASKGMKKKLAVIYAVIMVLLLLSGIMLKNRLDYLHSAEYRLADVDNVDYLDISDYDESVLTMLDGRTIGTLYMEDMDLKDISAISGINVREVDIAHNPDIDSLGSIKGCSGIESVVISQDMLELSDELLDAGIEVTVVR